MLADLLVRQAELVGEGLDTVCLFEGSQIFALQVLDERDFEGFLVTRVFLDAGDFAEPGRARGVDTAARRK